MTKEQLNELRDILNEKLPGQGYILLTGSRSKDNGTHIVSNVCKDHFIEIMTGIIHSENEQVDKNG